MVKMQTGPVTPTMTSGWPAATAKTLPQRNVDMSTSTSPILPAVLCARKAPKVMAGLIDVKNMKIAAESALVDSPSFQSDTYRGRRAAGAAGVVAGAVVSGRRWSGGAAERWSDGAYRCVSIVL